MGNDKSRSHYQGLLIEDPRVAQWTSETTASEAGPRPGVPHPLNRTGMTLQASGTQSADLDIRVRTQTGGFAEPDGAGFVWRLDGDPAWRGLDVPGTISHFEQMRFTDLSAPVKWYWSPHVVTLPDQTLVCAFYERDDSQALPFAVGIGRKPRGGSWSFSRINEGSIEPTVKRAEPNPCLVVLPSGRLLCFNIIEDVVREEAQVRMWFSDDDGVTWAIGMDNVLDRPVDITTGPEGYEVRRLRLAHGAGQILCLLHIVSNDPARPAQDVLRQYASSDEGNSFTFVEEWDGVTFNAGGFQDVVFAGEAFVVANAERLPTQFGNLAVRRLGNAYQPLSSMSRVIPSFVPAISNVPYSLGAADPRMTDGDLAITSAPDGALYIVGRATESGHYTTVNFNGTCFTLRSDDFGASWSPIGQYDGFDDPLLGTWFNSNSVQTVPFNLAVSWSEGRLAVLHNQRALPGVIAGVPDEPILSVSYLGGPSTVTLPGYQRFETASRRVNFEDVWLPLNEPQATTTQWTSGWNPLGFGMASLDQGFLSLTGMPIKGYRVEGLAASHTIEEGVIWAASLELVSGGSPAVNELAVVTTLADINRTFSLSVRITSNEIHFIDQASGATVATLPIVTSDGVDILLGMSQGNFTCWARIRSQSSDRVWNSAQGVVSDSGPTGGVSSLEWGKLAMGLAEAKFYTFQMVTGPGCGLQLAGGQLNPNELMPHPYSAVGGTYCTDGVMVRATSGTTIRSDEYSIKTRYDYAIENIFNPNPRKVWRSTDLEDEVIAWRVSEHGNASLQSDVVGLALYNCNFPSAILQGYDASSSSWVTLAPINFYNGASALGFERSGDTVSPAGLSVNNPLFYAGELEGALFSFGSSAGRKVVSHLTGKWASSANTRELNVVLDGVDDSEPGSGGNGVISTQSGVWIIHLQGSKYQGFRLQMSPPSVSTPAMADDYFEIGRLVFGPVVIHGDQTSWGRTIETSTGTELQEARDRTTRSRKVAPTRRIIEYGWTDGVDTSKSSSPAFDADPDFVSVAGAGSSEPVAFKDISPWDFEGTFHLLSGPHNQVVYLPRVTTQELDTYEALTRRNQHALCRITSPVNLETVQGEENESEVVRVASVTLTEDV